MHVIIIIFLGEGPDPAEIFTIVQISETKIAIKSGYQRYLSVNTAGEVIGREEAIGMREQWEAVFEDVRTSLILTYSNNQLHNLPLL